VIKNIDLVGAVEFPAVDGKGMVYDNNEDNNDVAVIDAKTKPIALVDGSYDGDFAYPGELSTRRGSLSASS
jgi:hypothetical protein